jgi:DNA polymerase-1
MVLDFETTNIQRGSPWVDKNELVLACYKIYDGLTGSYALPRTEVVWGNEFSMAPLLRDLATVDFLVAHNAKFELGWLHRCGFDISTLPVYDTMLAEWVIAGNRNWRLNLNACLARRDLPSKGNVVSSMMGAGVCPSEIPQPWLERYCLRDVILTNELYRKQMWEMQDTRLLPVVWSRCFVVPALTDIERRGLMLDTDKVQEQYTKHHTELMTVLSRLDLISGGINPRSPVQVANFIYGELGFEELTDRKGEPIRNKATKAFPDGAPKVDKATLLKLVAKTPEQAEFIELKQRQAKLASALDKNLAMFKGACEEKGGMIYATLNQGRTGTHRLASSGIRTYYECFDDYKGCQFQNLPNQFKSLFRSRKDGWLFGEVDYSQLEYRVAGQLGNEEVIYDEVRSGYDVHRYTASVLNGIPLGDVTYAQRRGAKADTFKPLYGGRSGSKAQRRYYAAFRDKYPRVTQKQEDWCIEVGNYKQLRTDTGLKFYWPNARVGHDDYLNVRTQVCNYPIQYFATGEIVPLGVAHLWHRIRATDCEMFLVNTVHDSVEAEMPEHEAELFVDLSTQALLVDTLSTVKTLYNYEVDVPLGVGFTLGSHWSEPDFDMLSLEEAVAPRFPSYKLETDGKELSVQQR